MLEVKFIANPKDGLHALLGAPNPANHPNGHPQKRVYQGIGNPHQQPKGIRGHPWVHLYHGAGIVENLTQQ